MKPALPALALAAALALSGCATPSTDGPTSKKLAQQRWDGARSNVLLSLGQSQYDTGNFDACRKSLDEAQKIDPENPKVLILSGKLGLERGDLDAAVNDLQAAQRIDPTDPQPDYLLGVIYERWQQPQRALDYYSSAAVKAPNELAYLMARAETFVTLDRRDEALRVLGDRVVFFEHSPAIRTALGTLLMQAGRPAEAVTMFRQASHLTDDAAVREQLALAELAAKNYREAEAQLDRLTGVGRDTTRVDLLLALGECRLQLNKPAEARDAFQSAARLAPANADAWLALAKASLAADDLRRADSAVQKAASLRPAGASVSLLLGYVRLKQDRTADALAAFRRASELAPADPVALCMVGYVLEQTGQGDRAVYYYGRALKLDPRDELAQSLMASVDTAAVGE